MSSLAGKVAVVTGGNSGIGLATARAFHANGAKVVITGRDRGTLEEVSRELGHDVLAVPADVSKLSEIDQLMARAYETFGKLDILFVNAGIYKGAPLEEVDEGAFDEMLNANFKGAYFTVQKALPFFNEPASIIFNGSVNALTGIANSSLYTANKGAVHALARALGTHWSWYSGEHHHDWSHRYAAPGPIGHFARDPAGSGCGAYQPFAGQAFGPS